MAPEDINGIYGSIIKQKRLHSNCYEAPSLLLGDGEAEWRGRRGSVAQNSYPDGKMVRF